VEKILDGQPCLTFLDEYHMPYSQWLGDKITPVRIGKFYIAPPWNKPWVNANSLKEELPIVLDPGVVFGTGTHTTTHDCLEALELAFCDTAKVNSVLDLGTGTGLLALAASILGSRNTLAVDFNFLAVRTALKNVRLNHLENKVLVVQGRAEDFIDSSVDLVIANIHYDVLKNLVTSQAFFSKKRFIFSGLLPSEARDLLFRLSQKPVKIVKRWEGEGIWHTFYGKIY
jgi:ribosomal protein L11 methyltransferase